MTKTPPTFDENNCVLTFDASFPQEVQEAMILAVSEAAREAAEVFQRKGIQRPQRKQTQAGLRRALLETKLREIAEQYGLDDAMDIIHEGRRSANLVIRNGLIALSQKYDKLDYAKYRETLARMNAVPLFTALKAPSDGDVLYAVLNYTLDEFDTTGATVASVDVVFPAPMGRVPVAKIDLIERAARTIDVEEEVAAEVGIKTKKAASARRSTRKGKKEA